MELLTRMTTAFPKRMVGQTIMWLLPICVSACGFASFEDISTKPAYAKLVQKHFRSTGMTIIHGVTMDRNYAPILDHYTVTMPPGFAGREVLSREDLPPGTEFRVMKIMRCTDCYLDFGERVHLVENITSSGAYGSAEIHVPIDLISDKDPPFVELSRLHDNRS